MIKMDSGLIDGTFFAQEELLADISNCFKDSLYTDITLIMSDGVRIKASKFILACRCPFFATMLFGFMKESDCKEIELSSCDSKTMGIILSFIYKGSVKLSNLSIQTLLDLLETSRLMCLDLLVEGVQLHIKTRFYDLASSLGDVLLVYDWCVGHKFEDFSEEILDEISLRMSLDDPQFAKLSAEALIRIILSRKCSTAEIDLFTCVSRWLDLQTQLCQQKKGEMVSCINLENIDREDLITNVRKSGLFSDSDISDALEKQTQKTKNKAQRCFLCFPQTWEELTDKCSLCDQKFDNSDELFHHNDVHIGFRCKM